MNPFWKNASVARLMACLLAAAAGAELGARAEDALVNSVELTGTPAVEDLWTSDGRVMHGKPHARFKAVTLNDMGLQGPDVLLTPKQPDCPRVLFLGSSETFGFPTVRDSSYPAQATRLLKPAFCGDILNAGIPGLTVGSMLKDWPRLAEAKPDIVFIYPATLFYLSPRDPKPSGSAPSTTTGAPSEPGIDPAALLRDLLARSRFIGRLKDAIDVPDVIQRRRDQRNIDQAIASHDAGWQFEDIPTERLEELKSDVRALIDAVAASGAKPVLMSHAVRVAREPRPEDAADLRSMRTNQLRATEPVLAKFPYAANEEFRTLAAEKGIRFLDVAQELSGHREYFVDMVHFSTPGTERMAGLVARVISETAPSRK